MAVTDSFVEFVLEQLEPVGAITPKRMFGGVGLYAGDLFFALLAGDVLYLKADDTTRREFEAAGARPFQPYPDRPRGGGTMRYYGVPVAILEDTDEVTRWARTSVAVARAQHASPPPRRRTIKRPRSRTPSKRASSSRKPAAGRKNRRR